ncbi:MAG: hypothetical protein JNN04_14535 [Cyclobacteriaceae bacterium]|nr:hypothetical protein [Cyclobacteriaceae bacterium]
MKKIASLLLVAVSLPVFAHPGHGTQNPLSPGHYVANPEHAIPLTLAIGAAIVLATWFMTRRSRSSR